MNTLGKLTRIKNLRGQWPDEARHFTPWLAQPENLGLIGETLGFGEDWLELIEVEAGVGRFSADILCQDTSSEDGYVIIENQFGQTDHDHLGKLLTYAAGRDAKTVLWIAEHIRDEHRAAIDLLNNATNEDFQFFALEIELWQIGDSAIAPRFSVIAKPNNWSRHVNTVARRAKTEGLSDLKKQYIRYWSGFKEKLEDTSDLRSHKASSRQWIHMRLGRRGFVLTANVNSQERWIQAHLEVSGDRALDYFQLLERDRQEINHACGFPLSWEPLESGKRARIAIRRENTDPTAEDTWPDQHDWLVDKLNILRDIFRDRVRNLDLDDLTPQTSDPL